MAQATTYAVHTEACTYLLDEGGICCRILSPGGLVTQGMSAAIGAQFVACLDLSLPGGLVAELRVGAAALFTAKDEQGRYVLLRTSLIHSIESRQSERPFLAPPVIPAALPTRKKNPSIPPKPPPKSGRVAKQSPLPALPRPPSPVVLRGGEKTGPSLAEETLSLAKPLYKPPAPPPPDRPRAPPVPPPRSFAIPSPRTVRKSSTTAGGSKKTSTPPPVPVPPVPSPPPIPISSTVSKISSGPPDIPTTPPRLRRPDPGKKGKR